jgi:hypothetical protein
VCGAGHRDAGAPAQPHPLDMARLVFHVNRDIGVADLNPFESTPPRPDRWGERGDHVAVGAAGPSCRRNRRLERITEEGRPI